MGQELRGFGHMYRRHAEALLSGGGRVVPPGHPLYRRQDSAEALLAQNEKLSKENAELRKRLEKAD